MSITTNVYYITPNSNMLKIRAEIHGRHTIIVHGLYNMLCQSHEYCRREIFFFFFILHIQRRREEFRSIGLLKIIIIISFHFVGNSKSFGPFFHISWWKRFNYGHIKILTYYYYYCYTESFKQNGRKFFIVKEQTRK